MNIHFRKVSSFLFLSIIFLLNYISKTEAQTPFFKQFYPNRDNINLRVNVVYQDTNGFLWIGTSEGLYQYNGNEYTLFRSAKMSSSVDVSAVFQDRNDTIWVGFRNGTIAKVINEDLVDFNPPEGLPQKAITSILQDKKGTMWFTTAGEGVYYFLKSRLYSINADDGLNDNYSYTSLEDKTGKIWIGTDQGIAICQAVQKKKIVGTIKQSDGLADEIVRVLKSDSKGNIWIGTQDKGVYIFNWNEQKVKVPRCFTNWTFGQINDMLFSNGEIWIATEEKGVINSSLNEENSSKTYSSYGNFKFPKINNILQDHEGNIWMSSNGGLIRSHGNWLMFLSEIKNQKINYVHSIFCDHKNNLIFTPDQELMILSLNNPTDNSKKFTITLPENLTDIVSIYEDTTGCLWIGTMGEGLFRFNPQSGEKIRVPGIDQESNSILSIAGDGNTVWLGTFGGALKLNFYNGNNFKKTEFKIQKFENQKELGNYFIYTVFIDSKKRVWFGTDQQGITFLDHEKFYNFNEKNGLNGNTVFGITEDVNGSVWFSVQNGGIYKYDGKVLKNYSSSEGLRDLNVTSLVSYQDKIIMIHRRGIDMLHTSTGKIDYYGTENNLSDINPDINSVTKDVNGRIWFGTEKGIVMYNPGFNSDPAGPKIVLNKVTLFEHKDNVMNIRDFSYNQNYFTFDYTGIWFTDPDRIKYQYKLEGYNSDWIDTRDKRISFPNLSSGKYSFKVRTSLNKSFIYTDEASYDFIIEKPFWKELWFRFLALAVISAFVFIYLKRRDNRIRQLEMLKKEKVEFQFETLKSQVNPHFLFNSFNTLISIIEKDKNTAVEYVENLSEYFRNLINYRDKDLIPLDEELKLSHAYYFLQQKRFGNNLNVIINIDSNKNQWTVPPLVVQILMENAIKHNAISKETPLLIDITIENEKLIIRNNINIKNSIEKSTGTGIKNVINRYTLLTKEKVEIVKTEKEFIVAIPLIKK